MKTNTELEYWIERCRLIEICDQESPCDPDVIDGQIQAWKDYHSFIKENGGRPYKAIASHEAGKWHYLPKKPIYNGRFILVEYKSLGAKGNFAIIKDFEIRDNAIRWRELPAPFQEGRDNE